MIGRDAEFVAIGDALRRPDLAAVLIAGEAGVGKSHLLGAAMRHAERHGFAVISVTGTRALADIPLAAFASMLPSRLAGDAGDLVQIRRVIHERAGNRPVLLGLDDAHLLDEASAALAHQLASDLTAFVIATIRSGEVPPDAISALHKDGVATRISLEPLRRGDLGAFALATLRTAVTIEVEDALWERTLGNPLFGRELLLQARETGSIVQREGRFHLLGPFASSDTLADLVEARLAGLSDEHQRAAALVAVGGPLEVDLLERLVQPEALVELEEARVLAADDVDGTLVVRFIHPVYADATRRRLGRLTARQLLRELATALDSAPRKRAEDVLRIATWRLDAGTDASPELLLQAARVANRRNDFALAERLGHHAFELEPTLHGAATVANAYVEQGRYEEADALLRDERIDRSVAPARDRVRAAMVEATIQYWGFGDGPAAVAIIDRMEAELPSTVDVAASFRASIDAASSRPVEAMSHAPIGSVTAHTPFGVFSVLTALTAVGKPDTALTAVGPLPEAGRSTSSAIIGVAYGFALIETGRVGDALRAGLDGWEKATRDGDLHGRVGWAIANGWAELNYGRRDAAARWFHDAVELARNSAAARHGLRWALGGGLLAAAQGADVDTARALRDRLDALPHHDAIVHGYMAMRGRAWLAAAEGRTPDALEMLRAMAADALPTNNHAPRMRMLMDIARLGRPDIAAELVDAGPTEFDGTFLPTVVSSIRGLAGSDPAPLIAAAETLHECGFRVLAAELAAGGWQRAQARGDDARIVAQYARRAQELRELIESYATLALTDAPPEVSLSRREREIATLVAAGRTSREVADELIIGVRTVESHLARVYAKLGVRSRTDLSDALGLTGAPS